MAARKQRMHPEEVRRRIQTSQLINRLTGHALSPTPLMDSSQVNAARALLNKVLPDLSSTTLTGDADNPLEIINRIERVIIGENAADQDSEGVPTTH